jgi:hypothetical protein
MSEAVVRPNSVQQLSVRGTRRAAPLAVREWTGRSAISSVTTTPRPAIATTEEGKTRVSGMRVSARTTGALAGERPAAPGRTTPARRNACDPPLMGG